MIKAESRWAWLTLALLLAAEVRLFSGSLSKFFDHDSLFYLVNHPRTWEQFLRLLAGPDVSQQYRPLTLGALGLVIPWLGTDPYLYHWIPMLFHALNTVLLFVLARKLSRDSWSALAVTAFWAFHSAAGIVTSGIAFISDFLMAALLLSSLILAVEGYAKRRLALAAASLGLYALAALTKEAAVTAPLAVLVCLALRDLGDPDRAPDFRRIGASLRRILPFALPYMAITIAHTGLLLHWLRSGLLYSQAPSSAYAINPLGNLLAKTKYLYWALNLPDSLSISHAARNRALAVVLVAVPLLLWAADLARRRLRLSAAEWGGIIWLAGLSMPAFLLSQRTAKWYLYVPVVGLALALGTLAARLRTLLPRPAGGAAGLVVLALFLIPAAFSSSVQTRSYWNASDSSYQSEVLQACLKDLQAIQPVLPRRVILFFLPSHDVNVVRLLASQPIDRGQLFELYSPGTDVRTLFAHKGDRLPEDFRGRPDILILHFLDGRLHDVTAPYKQAGRLNVYLLPTFEKRTPPLMEKEPIGGWDLYRSHVHVAIADRGDPLPADYHLRGDLWIIQYLMGHFYDVTAYYRGRRRHPALRLVTDTAGVLVSVSRDELYPDYERFATPTGGPVFFITPEKDIFTQIGGSTAVVRVPAITAGSRLRFDVSWMYDMGDGGWAEVRLRARGSETTLFREYMNPNPPGRGFSWREVDIDLSPHAGKDAELVLECYNDPGKNTISDWLNWRDLSIRNP